MDVYLYRIIINIWARLCCRIYFLMAMLMMKPFLIFTGRYPCCLGYNPRCQCIRVSEKPCKCAGMSSGSTEMVESSSTSASTRPSLLLFYLFCLCCCRFAFVCLGWRCMHVGSHKSHRKGIPIHPPLCFCLFAPRFFERSTTYLTGQRNVIRKAFSVSFR
jgi:hypothetical protein